ncbi:MAG: Ribose 5-phosphate isomerase [Cyanobacteria bacterium RYN_339]|nr:Ribose 5-phosphate isomerase [Cyanobacteria bacterium RYN_339]
MTDRLAAKRRAAEASLAYVKDGMRVGLGTGTTAELVIGLIAERGLKITAVPTSRRTARLAEAAGIPVTDFTSGLRLDLTIDGADEVDPHLNLLKGRGGALLYEKIVAVAADVFVVVVDGSKRVANLGAVPLPVEVIPFAAPRIQAAISAMGAVVTTRLTASGNPFRTQAGHQILDAAFGTIYDPAGMAAELDGLAGVVEHGLFLGLASHVLVAEADQVLTL